MKMHEANCDTPSVTVVATMFKQFTTLPVYLVYPMKARVTIVWLCLVIQDFGRS
jgi:hypothetical protein